MSAFLATDPFATAPLELDRAPAARRVSLARPTHRSVDPPALPISTLVEIAEGLARAEALWRPHVGHDPLSRTSVRLVGTEAYEVWLLGWTRDQRVDFHDHGGANAAFVVLEGELREITLETGGTTIKRLRAGRTATVPSGTIHDVINPRDAPATSLHVYANPLKSMTFYDRDGRASHTELVERVPALISSAAPSRALHPGGSDR